ncbi:NAD-dependent epimerase/dehydratase family protein [Actinomadura violacea]|uniref:NAD-dependent epimerase/dehydratase family protein n=1 Tax=Actinomadura violacea TaxID=2819934 RepID=A0ABS3S0U9_9ACTN|nr:NAD-dependent epimerase/dehydratase family protein [Actinomadura violacea]MBO2462635.1 NAD-dependent epimerase/dehydratase family protein [Actinomadura violacea]
MRTRSNVGPGRRAVIGAGGFIGRALCGRLRAGGAQVMPVTRDTRWPIGPDGTPLPELRDVEVLYYLATSVTPALAQTRPELVAADRERFNGLLDALATTERPPVVVLNSTGLTVCESADAVPCTEDAFAAPKSAYAKAKLAMENDLLSRTARVPGVVLRMSNVYGPGHGLRRGYGVVAHWLDAAANGRPLDLYGDADTVRDYLYIDDAVDALAGLGPATAELPAGVFNIATGAGTSLGRLLSAIRDVADRELTVRLRPGRGFDHPVALLDVARARRLLGWRARTPLSVGLERAWATVIRTKEKS